MGLQAEVRVRVRSSRSLGVKAVNERKAWPPGVIPPLFSATRKVSGIYPLNLCRPFRQPGLLWRRRSDSRSWKQPPRGRSVAGEVCRRRPWSFKMRNDAFRSFAEKSSDVALRWSPRRLDRSKCSVSSLDVFRRRRARTWLKKEKNVPLRNGEFLTQRVIFTLVEFENQPRTPGCSGGRAGNLIDL